MAEIVTTSQVSILTLIPRGEKKKKEMETFLKAFKPCAGAGE